MRWQFLIRLLSSQMLNRKRLGRDIYMRGSKSGIRSIYDSKYSLTLFEILKNYSNIIMTKDFHRMNIPSFPCSMNLQCNIIYNQLQIWSKSENIFYSILGFGYSFLFMTS